MSKNISVADDVYEALKRRKRGRSFSETIREALEAGGRISDVVGQQVLPPDTLETAKDEVEGLSQGTVSRLEKDEDEDAIDEAA